MSSSINAPVSAVDRSARAVISLVIPVFNEEGSVGELHRQIASALESVEQRYEVLFIDDGSTDGTLRSLEELRGADSRVRVVSLRRRFGKTAALVCGFRESTGRVVITLDGDLQDDPNEIPKFLAALDSGHDLAVGWKKERRDPLSKTLPSKVFNTVVRSSSGVGLHDFNCGFKAYRREVLDDLRLYGDMHRFIPVLAAWKGYRVAEIPVVHHERRFGKSKFGAGRIVSGLVDFVRVLFLTRYMQQPLRLFGTAGMLLFGLGLVGGLYLAVLKIILGQSIGLNHLPLLFLTVMLILFGTMLVAIGLMGEAQRHQTYQATDEYSVKTRLG
jgi:glycosyltransferase involved in cell wall biosynthesis